MGNKISRKKSRSLETKKKARIRHKLQGPNHHIIAKGITNNTGGKRGRGGGLKSSHIHIVDQRFCLVCEAKYAQTILPSAKWRYQQSHPVMTCF